MCVGDNKIRIRRSVDHQWTVCWVNFPPPIGRRPAIILSNNTYTDGADVIVVPTTTSSPRDREFSKLWIPIEIDCDRSSYVMMNNVTTINKSCLDKIIGWVPLEYRDIIKERFFALMTGDPVKSLCTPVENMEDTETESPKTTELENPAPELTTTSTPAPTSTPNKTPSPIVEEKVNVTVAMTILKSITDKNADLSPSDKYMASKRLQISSVPDDVLSTLFVNMVRTHGYAKLERTPTMRTRYNAIKNELVARGIIGEITMKFIHNKINLSHRDPTIVA